MVTCFEAGGRSAACACLQTFASKVQDTDALAAMYSVGEGLLTGSREGKVRNVQERAGIVSGVAALASAPGRGRARLELAAKVATLLCRLYG
jgi:hypothetical protein